MIRPVFIMHCLFPRRNTKESRLLGAMVRHCSCFLGGCPVCSTSTTAAPTRLLSRRQPVILFLVSLVTCCYLMSLSDTSIRLSHHSLVAALQSRAEEMARSLSEQEDEGQGMLATAADNRVDPASAPGTAAALPPDARQPPRYQRDGPVRAHRAPAAAADRALRGER